MVGDRPRLVPPPSSRPFEREDAPPGAATEIGPDSSAREGARGTVRIAPAVLIELIELSVRDVSGVAGFGPRRRMERDVPGGEGGTTGQPNGQPSPKSYEAGGIGVRVAGDRIDADVSIVVRRGANILELSRTIQRRVGVAAGRMLGMTVTEVNVYVADIVDELDEKE